MTKLAALEDLHLRLLNLFEGPLSGVKFPDVEAEILAAHAQRAKKAATRVDALRTELDDARAVLDEEEGKLEGRIERALAYLRVYVDGDAVLSAELDALSERVRPARAEAPAAGAPRRRGRPTKASGMLALTAEPASTGSAHAGSAQDRHEANGADPSYEADAPTVASLLA